MIVALASYMCQGAGSNENNQNFKLYEKTISIYSAFCATTGAGV